VLASREEGFEHVRTDAAGALEVVSKVVAFKESG
jgi:hypothetical protein